MSTPKVEATHTISAVYYPHKHEIELTWEDLLTKEHAYFLTHATPEEGAQIASVVMPCVYQGAVSAGRVTLPVTPEFAKLCHSDPLLRACLNLAGVDPSWRGSSIAFSRAPEMVTSIFVELSKSRQALQSEITRMIETGEAGPR